MSAIKTVALAGASGNLGPAILTALLDSGTFVVTILTREGSSATFPSGVKVIPVDYTSLESLTAALHGQDAVVSTLVIMALPTQTLMIDAAIAAGVKRFIPCEFGSDTYNPKARPLLWYTEKLAVQNYLAKESRETSLTYTEIICSGFFDFGLAVGFFVNFKDQKATLYDGGDRPFSVTRLASVGIAVVGVLKHSEETKNRPVYVHEAVVTQNQLIGIAEEVAPGKKWETEVVGTEMLEREAYESLKGPKEKWKLTWVYDFLFRAMFGEGYGWELKNFDNELLGVKMMSYGEIKEFVAGYVAK